MREFTLIGKKSKIGSHLDSDWKFTVTVDGTFGRSKEGKLDQMDKTLNTFIKRLEEIMNE